jgi:hypothetical protein
VNITFEYVEQQSDLLKRIAGTWPPGSSEDSAIRLAALALLFTAMSHAEGFIQFLRDNQDALSAQQRGELRGLGLI